MTNFCQTIFYCVHTQNSDYRTERMKNFVCVPLRPQNTYAYLLSLGLVSIRLQQQRRCTWLSYYHVIILQRLNMHSTSPFTWMNDAVACFIALLRCIVDLTRCAADFDLFKSCLSADYLQIMISNATSFLLTQPEMQCKYWRRNYFAMQNEL